MLMNKRVVHYISLAITPILSTALFIIPVYADEDYEFYYPDPDSYIAYDYFFSHGYSHLLLSGTGSNNITYNVDLSNKGSNDGTIKGTDNLTGSSHTTGTINSNGSSTLGAKYMVCSTNNGTSASQTYSCYFSNRSSGVSNSQSINIGFNENTYSDYSNVDVYVNETINQDIDTDIKGTISASNAYSHKLYSKLPYLTGTYEHPTAFNSNDAFNVNDSDGSDSYLIFIADKYHQPTYKAYTQNNNSYSVNGSVNTLGSGWRLYIYHMTGNSNNITLDIDWLNDNKIIPVYVGKGKFLTDEIRERVGMETITHKYLRENNELLSNGNSSTSNIVDNATNANNSVNNKINSFDNIENQQVTQMNNRLNNININSDLFSNNGFLNSAQWVKVQFDRMTVNTPIGSVLSFSLILGLALIFLGKIR